MGRKKRRKKRKKNQSNFIMPFFLTLILIVSAGVFMMLGWLYLHKQEEPAEENYPKTQETKPAEPVEEKDGEKRDEEEDGSETEEGAETPVDDSRYADVLQDEAYMAEHNIYAKELFIAGGERDFLSAGPFFETSCADTERSLDEIKEAACVVARAARIGQDVEKFFKYALKVVACEGCSEICCELGAYFLERRDLEEAIVWFYNAVYETESILNIHSSGDIPLRGLSECYRLAGNTEQAEAYGKLAAEWKAE